MAGSGERGWGRAGAAGVTPLSPLSLSLSLPAGLLEIRAVAVRTVAIKGVQSSRYLCMDEAGRLHGQVSARAAFPEGIFHPGTAAKEPACSNNNNNGVTKLSGVRHPPSPSCSP